MQRISKPKSFADPKEHLVNNDNLERNNERLREMTKNTREKRSPPSDDDNVITNTTANDGALQMTPFGSKKSKTKNDSSVINKNGDVNSQGTQQRITSIGNTNEDEHSPQSIISNDAIAYAIENHLPAIKIECSPPLGNRDMAKKFIINFFNYIRNDFRKEYPGNTKPIGFHHWWINPEGKNFYGVTNDADLYIYLCNENHYPSQIDNVKLKPEPPKRLPPQHTIVIKFVPNEMDKDDIKDEIKHTHQSLFTIDDMMGTMRSKSRHIRTEFYRKDDYEKIMKNGKIGLQGQIFEVEEYLAPPKILICSKCNTPGHAKKTCQSSIDICRRCGQERKTGEKHIECPIMCHHCGGSHTATDYKCPTIIKFRQDLLSRLKTDRNKLPPNIKLFIPVDCRLNGDRNRILTNGNDTEPHNSALAKPPLTNPWTTMKYTRDEQMSTNDINKSIKTLTNELAEMKEFFQNEREKLRANYETQIKSIKQGWIMIQQQIQAQNQCITLMSTMIKDNATAMNQIITTVLTLGEALKAKLPDEIDQGKIETCQLLINTSLNHIKNLNDSYAKQEQNLSLVMNKQSMLFQSTLESILRTTNE